MFVEHDTSELYLLELEDWKCNHHSYFYADFGGSQHCFYPYCGLFLLQTENNRDQWTTCRCESYSTIEDPKTIEIQILQKTKHDYQQSV